MVLSAGVTSVNNSVFMDLVSKLFILPILLIALGTIWFLAKKMGIEAPKHRYAPIDGLRGFLATFVFLHHSSMMYYFIHVHKWSQIPSSLFNHFGSTSVALFFMITAFLFFSKLIDAFKGQLDWTKLYVSRVVRIMPLYLLSILMLFLVVGIISNFTLREPFGNLSLQLGQWTLFMEPDINRLAGSRHINAGVQWSLAFEWLFYSSLAIMGMLFFRIRTSYTVLLLATLSLAVFILIIFEAYPDRAWIRMAPFLSGIAAAIFARNDRTHRVLSSNWIAPVLLIVLYFAVACYRSVFAIVPFLCISVFFIGIACGNNLFGILTLRAAGLLGQISYSIYLLHGLFLFTIFYFVIGFDGGAQLSFTSYWLTIAFISFFMIIFCSFTYRYIEKPSLDSATALTKWINRHLRRHEQFLPV
jgi:peptidoglycan/LPS O-acetylase OafA/YrhL